MNIIPGCRPQANGAVITASRKDFWHTRVELGSVDKVRVGQYLHFLVATFLGIPYSEIFIREFITQQNTKAFQINR